MIEFFLDPAFWATLAILIGLELALGVDNIIFVSLVLARVPEEQRDRARRIGLAISAIVQIIVLAIILWIAGIDRTAFTLGPWAPGWNELAFLAGGLFLVYKAVSELHIHIEHGPRLPAEPPRSDPDMSFATAIVQVALINAVFSVDTIITAVGVTRSVEVIVVAILATTAIIYFATAPISAFIARHKSVRALALAFLLLIGGSLISEGLGVTPDPMLLYAVVGFGTLVLAAVKLGGHLRGKPQPAAAVVQERQEPVLETAQADETIRDDETLEIPAPIVQESTPKRRPARRKRARRTRASPQG